MAQAGFLSQMEATKNTHMRMGVQGMEASGGPAAGDGSSSICSAVAGNEEGDGNGRSFRRFILFYCWHSSATCLPTCLQAIRPLRWWHRGHLHSVKRRDQILCSEQPCAVFLGESVSESV